MLFKTLNLGISWHSARRQLSRLGEPKSCPAWQGYPTCRGETTRPPELSRPPRQLGDIHFNGWILQLHKEKLTRQGYLGVSVGLGHPRPYKWGAP